MLRPISLLALITLAVGCGSSDPEVTPVADSALETGDTGAIDTGSKVDTGVPPVPGCEVDLPSDFACAAPTKTAGKTTCTEAALQEFVVKCLNEEITVPADCAGWKTANADCAACVADWSWDRIPGKVYPDDYKCYWSTFDATCGKTVNCLFSCQDEVCTDCVDEEAATCYEDAEKSGGRCWDVAGKDAAGCFDKTDLSGCNVDEIYANVPKIANLREQLLKFYRGACRDNGDWKNAKSGGDAGTPDTGSDAAAETSVSDAADGG